MAREKPRFGYRRLHVLLGPESEQVNHKRVHRIYREAGLALRRKKRKHCVRLSTPLGTYTAANQEWALDFVHDAVACGRSIRVLNVIDAFTRESLAMEVDTSFAGLRVTRVCEPLTSGVQKFTRKQSSPGTVTAEPRWSKNASSSAFARFFPSMLKCAESCCGQTRPYANALRTPVQGSGCPGGMKRRAPEVDAPYGTPLKMYTPFRLNPRIFPALVSTTVEALEAMTLARPQGAAPDCGLRCFAFADSAINFVCALAEPASPAENAAMPPSRARLPGDLGVEWSSDALKWDCFSESLTGLLFLWENVVYCGSAAFAM